MPIGHARTLPRSAAVSIPLIDPQRRFEEQAEASKARGKRLYFVLDDHWNEEGNELVARILHEYILRRKEASGKR